jgi:transposase-like protein
MVYWNYPRVTCYSNLMEKYMISIRHFKDLLDAWEQIKGEAPFYVEFSRVRCKHCNSDQISKYGLYKNVQLWWCHQCKRKFTGSKAPPGMKISLEQIQSALSMYYKGIPLSFIRKQLEEEFDYSPSGSTIYRWTRQFTDKVSEDVKFHRPQVGSIWIAFESTILVGFKEYWILDLIDADTHYLLASRLSTRRNSEDIRVLTELAMQRAHKIPEKIVTRRPSKYLKVIDQALNLEFKNIQITCPEKGYTMKFSTYWHHILNGRSNITRGLKSLEIAQLVLKGWVSNYNYYSQQKSLQDKTPAQAAKVDYRHEAMIKAIITEN